MFFFGAKVKKKETICVLIQKIENFTITVR